MRGKPIAVNSGLTVQHDIKPGSGEDSLVFSGSGLSGPLYLGTSSLHIIFQHMGREAVLRLLGEPELPVGRPPGPGDRDRPATLGRVWVLESWSDSIQALVDEMLGRIEAQERFRTETVQDITELDDRLQRAEGLLGQALGHIEKLKGNDTATAHRLQVTVERTEGLEERLKREIKAVLRLITKNRELSTRSWNVFGERLSALEAQAKACAAGECPSCGAGKEDRR